MTDAQTALAQVREALNKANDASETIGESTWYRKAELRAVCGDAMLDGDRDFIAACSPANIAAILVHVYEQKAEIERLRELLCKCDMRTRLVGDGCEFCNPQLSAELAKEQR